MKERDGGHLNRRTGGKPFATIWKNIVAAGTPGLMYLPAVCLGLNGSSGMYAANGMKGKAGKCQAGDKRGSPTGQYRYSGWKYGTGLAPALLLIDSSANSSSELIINSAIINLSNQFTFITKLPLSPVLPRVTWRKQLLNNGRNTRKHLDCKWY